MIYYLCPYQLSLSLRNNYLQRGWKFCLLMFPFVILSSRIFIFFLNARGYTLQRVVIAAEVLTGGPQSDHCWQTLPNLELMQLLPQG